MELDSSLNKTLEKSRLLRIASIVVLIGNIFIFLTKLIVAYLTSSLAILADAIDTSSDIGIAIMSLVVSFIIKMPQNKKYPYGRIRAETIASLILSLIIIIMGFQLFLTSFNKLLFSQHNEINHKFQLASIIVIISSIVLKLLLALNQFIFAKKAESAMLLANAKNMSNDVLLSASVLISISCTYYFNMPLIDILSALLIGLWIIYSGLSLFWELNVELMDGTENDIVYKKLFDAVASMPNVHNPHRARVRKMANLFDITLDIEVDAQTTVKEAHEIAEELTCKIKDKIENVYDVVIHVEPYGILHDEAEGFGLSPKDIS